MGTYEVRLRHRPSIGLLKHRKPFEETGDKHAMRQSVRDCVETKMSIDRENAAEVFVNFILVPLAFFILIRGLEARSEAAEMACILSFFLLTVFVAFRITGIVIYVNVVAPIIIVAAMLISSLARSKDITDEEMTKIHAKISPIFATTLVNWCQGMPIVVTLTGLFLKWHSLTIFGITWFVFGMILVRMTTKPEDLE